MHIYRTGCNDRTVQRMLKPIKARRKKTVGDAPVRGLGIDRVKNRILRQKSSFISVLELGGELGGGDQQTHTTHTDIATESVKGCFSGAMEPKFTCLY